MSALTPIINKVGYWEASEWGASVISHELVTETKERQSLFNDTVIQTVYVTVVRYYAVEHGEKFYFDIPLNEVYKKYQALKKRGC